MTLQTTRLRLRPFREDDVQAIYDNSAAPEVGLNAGVEAAREPDGVV